MDRSSSTGQMVTLKRFIDFGWEFRFLIVKLGKTTFQRKFTFEIPPLYYSFLGPKPQTDRDNELLLSSEPFEEPGTIRQRSRSFNLISVVDLVSQHVHFVHRGLLFSIYTLQMIYGP